MRRKRARERAEKNQWSELGPPDRVPNGKGIAEREKIRPEEKRRAKSIDEENNDARGRGIDERPRKDVAPLGENGKNGRDRRTASVGSSSSIGSPSSASSDSSSSSDSFSSSSDESDGRVAAAMPVSASRPLFVPKSKRGTVAEVEMHQKKLEDAEKRRLGEAEKRAIRSRALVAEISSSSAAAAAAANGNEGDEFDTGEAGGEFIPVPDDADPDDPDLVAAERDAWEVRELMRILRDVDVALEREKERRELGRRRALTDEERLAEDRSTGRYRAPGEARRRAARGRTDGSGGGDGGGVEDGGGRHLQRFHHRGAFYMDEDTLDRAGPDDVRHRAAEYSRAATGEDKIDKTALPEVMQVKKFGFAGYSTKYKGLAKEDTTDRTMEFLPIRGRGGGSAGRGRGGGYGNNGGDGRGGDRQSYG